jgi:hypothetical protein
MPVRAIPIELNDGKRRELRFDFNALVRMETELKMQIGEIGALMAGAGSLGHIRAIVWAGLSHAERGLSLEDVGNLIDLDKLGYIAGKIAEAFEAAFPVDREPKKDDGPKPESGESPGTGQAT